ncbi:MAG: Do family serine endopeptidase [Maricaulaceae bacterium]
MTMLRALTLALCVVAANAAQAQLFERRPPSDAGTVQLSFAPIVREAAPAVVNVYSRRVVRTRSPFASDPFFQFFFGERGGASERVQQSLGSGVIVREDGVIVTNNHVIKGADELIVVLQDRREFEAELLLADERTDLAVLRIDVGDRPVPVLPFDRTGDAEVGDLVLAIGNPFGVGQTVTHGIISALGRSDVGVTDFSFFIQTDAAINPGNSGGALVDLDGELIGVNTAIFSRSGGSNGIGFAIPAELVERVVESALGEGRIVRPWLGVKGQTVTNNLALALELDRPQGVVVDAVYPRGPADRAGLKAGDVILTVDGVEVNDEAALRFRFATRRVGETADVEYVRDGRRRTARARAEPPVEDPERDVREITFTGPFRGAEVANLSPAFAEEMRLDPFATGVVITRLNRRDLAGRVGFRPGDRIVAINGEEIETTRELERLLAVNDGARVWEVAIERNGRLLRETVRL